MKAGFDLTDGLLSPFTIPPKHPITLARYGAVGLLPAHTVAKRGFDTDEARALFAGLAGHSILSLKAPVTAGYGLMLGVLAHVVGWPMARGGSQQIADALVGVLEGLGGTLECDHRVESLAELPPADAVLLDRDPASGDRARRRRPAEPLRARRWPGSATGRACSRSTGRSTARSRGPTATVARAATVHLGGTLDEITAAEGEVQAGRLPERPYVLLAQQSLFDPSRAPAGTHTAWAYCHVPNGSTVDMTDRHRGAGRTVRSRLS